MRWLVANTLGNFPQIFAKVNHIRSTSKNSNELLLKLAHAKGLDIPDTIDPEISKFIQECCIFDRKIRPTASQLFKSEFLSN